VGEGERSHLVAKSFGKQILSLTKLSDHQHAAPHGHKTQITKQFPKASLVMEVPAPKLERAREGTSQCAMCISMPLLLWYFYQGVGTPTSSMEGERQLCYADITINACADHSRFTLNLHLCQQSETWPAGSDPTGDLTGL